jgi:uncharacterized protein YdhG (YjbR/CyaY superfamily)
MMQSQAADVESYIAQAPLERRAALVRLRGLCHEILQGYEECLEYGMPCYKRGRALQVSFASQKQYISLYVLKADVVNEFRGALAGCSIGKGCIRFSRPDRIDFDVVRSLLARTAESPEKAC